MAVYIIFEAKPLTDDTDDHRAGNTYVSCVAIAYGRKGVMMLRPNQTTELRGAREAGAVWHFVDAPGVSFNGGTVFDNMSCRHVAPDRFSVSIEGKGLRNVTFVVATEAWCFDVTRAKLDALASDGGPNADAFARRLHLWESDTGVRHTYVDDWNPWAFFGRSVAKATSLELPASPESPTWSPTSVSFDPATLDRPPSSPTFDEPESRPPTPEEPEPKRQCTCPEF